MLSSALWNSQVKTTKLRALNRAPSLLTMTTSEKPPISVMALWDTPLTGSMRSLRCITLAMNGQAARYAHASAVRSAASLGSVQSGRIQLSHCARFHSVLLSQSPGRLCSHQAEPSLFMHTQDHKQLYITTTY